MFSMHIRAQIALRPSISVIFTPKFSSAARGTRGGRRSAPGKTPAPAGVFKILKAHGAPKRRFFEQMSHFLIHQEPIGIEKLHYEPQFELQFYQHTVGSDVEGIINTTFSLQDPDT